MTLRQGMLAAAGRAPRLLGQARHAAATFLRTLQNHDGGFRGRSQPSDLYYTVFALEGLIALGQPPEPAPIIRYLATFGEGLGLDLIHLACLARCWADIECGTSSEHPTPNSQPLTPHLCQALAKRIEAHRAADGGYSPSLGAQHGTAYGCFFALSALQDINCGMLSAEGGGRNGPPTPTTQYLTPERTQGILQSLASLRRDDYGYANERPLRHATTPATAAAVSVIKQIGGTVDAATAEWLLRRAAPEGGFFATEAAPLPDLLSTATALHALDGIAKPPQDVCQATGEFVTALQAESGGFRGLELHDEPDAEYTFYALLALGHLIWAD